MSDWVDHRLEAIKARYGDRERVRWPPRVDEEFHLAGRHDREPGYGCTFTGRALAVVSGLDLAIVRIVSELYNGHLMQSDICISKSQLEDQDGYYYYGAPLGG